MTELRGDRLFVAAGVLPTALLVLDSLDRAGLSAPAHATAGIFSCRCCIGGPRNPTPRRSRDIRSRSFSSRSSIRASARAPCTCSSIRTTTVSPSTCASASARFAGAFDPLVARAEPAPDRRAGVPALRRLAADRRRDAARRRPCTARGRARCRSRPIRRSLRRSRACSAGSRGSRAASTVAADALRARGRARQQLPLRRNLPDARASARASKPMSSGGPRACGACTSSTRRCFPAFRRRRSRFPRWPTPTESRRKRIERNRDRPPFPTWRVSHRGRYREMVVCPLFRLFRGLSRNAIGCNRTCVANRSRDRMRARIPARGAPSRCRTRPSPGTATDRRPPADSTGWAAPRRERNDAFAQAVDALVAEPLAHEGEHVARQGPMRNCIGSTRPRLGRRAPSPAARVLELATERLRIAADQRCPIERPRTRDDPRAASGVVANGGCDRRGDDIVDVDAVARAESARAVARSCRQATVQRSDRSRTR